MLHPSGNPESAANLSAAWQARCVERRVDTNFSRGERADELLRAVVDAVGQGNPTAALGRAARAWGGQFSEPSDAVTELTCLGGVLLSQGADGLIGQAEIAGASHTNGTMTVELSDPAWRRAALTDPLERLLVVWDQLMTEAVDAATSTLRSAALIDPLTGCANRRARTRTWPEPSEPHIGRTWICPSSSSTSTGSRPSTTLRDMRPATTHSSNSSPPCARPFEGPTRCIAPEAMNSWSCVRSPMPSVPGSYATGRTPGGPKFSWGTASLKSVQTGKGDDWGVLVAAADRDLYTRRHTRRSLAAPRRRRVAVASVAASVVAAATAATVMATSPANPHGSLAIGANHPSQTTLGMEPGAGTRPAQDRPQGPAAHPAPRPHRCQQAAGRRRAHRTTRAKAQTLGQALLAPPSSWVGLGQLGQRPDPSPGQHDAILGDDARRTTLAADVGSGGTANSGIGRSRLGW